jgi:hypothetical protein
VKRSEIRKVRSNPKQKGKGEGHARRKKNSNNDPFPATLVAETPTHEKFPAAKDVAFQSVHALRPL